MTHRIRPQDGASLIETSITLLIIAIITVPLVGIAFQLIMLPIDWQANITAIHETRHAIRTVSEDAMRSHGFYTSETPNYGTFSWTDYTLPVPRDHTVQYFYDEETQALKRLESTQGEDTLISVFTNLESYADFTIDNSLNAITVSVTSTADSLRDVYTYSQTMRVAKRVSTP
ncbi:MAG: hypothetical protein MK384_01130 [SAR202 cluster bacterium]|nr:hypothetical protein [SAR202 cluster bacterium]